MSSILIVEDEIIVALDIKRHLEKFGYSICSILSSAEEVIEKFDSLMPDLVLMDIHLSGKLDGLEASRIIYEKNKTPVILLTAYADDQTIQRAKLTQPYGYLIKPFEERALKTAIEIALYRSGMEKKLEQTELEKAKLKEQLFQAQKMDAIGRLSSSIAHDFNNVITAILGYSNLIIEEHSENKEIIQDVEGIRTAAQKANKLTKQLLSFSRNQPLLDKIVDINQVLTESERLLGRLVPENINLKIIIEAKIPYVKLDQNQFEQAIMNLVINARDAIKSNGSIIITSRNISFHKAQTKVFEVIPEGDYVCIEVTDTGTGIDPLILLRIFEPFFTTKEKGSGTGLGLAMVYGLVKQSNAFIDIETLLDSGTSFFLYFPAATGKMEANDTVIVNKIIPKKLASVLIVEDEDYIRDLVVRIMIKAGYRVLAAASPGDALLLAEKDENSFDILISDLIMPWMDGFSLWQRMKKTKPNLQALFISGYPDKAKEMNVPGCTVLLKPFSPLDLLNAVNLIAQ